MLATMHDASATTYYRTFSRQNDVLARIAPGDWAHHLCRCRRRRRARCHASEPGNPLTGAFSVEDVEPGDALRRAVRPHPLQPQLGLEHAAVRGDADAAHHRLHSELEADAGGLRLTQSHGAHFEVDVQQVRVARIVKDRMW